MKRAILARLEPLILQVRGNPRLQAGLALVALLLVGWIFQWLGDVRAANIRRLEDARTRYVQMRRLAGQDVWIQRANDAERLARALEAELPPVASPGLAQASLQGELQHLADSMGTGLRIDAQAPTRVEDTEVVEATATVAGALEPARAWELIHRIESGTSLKTIPVLVVRSDGANKTMSLTVKAYFRLSSGAVRKASAQGVPVTGGAGAP